MIKLWDSHGWSLSVSVRHLGRELLMTVGLVLENTWIWGLRSIDGARPQEAGFDNRYNQNLPSIRFHSLDSFNPQSSDTPYHNDASAIFRCCITFDLSASPSRHQAVLPTVLRHKYPNNGKGINKVRTQYILYSRRSIPIALHTVMANEDKGSSHLQFSSLGKARNGRFRTRYLGILKH